MKYLLSLLCAALVALTSSHASAGHSDEIGRLKDLADSLHSSGRTDSAAVVGMEAVQLAKESGDQILIVSTLSSEGVYLRSLGYQDQALECYTGALDIITSPDFRTDPGNDAIEEIASLYINLAVLDLDMQHKEEASAHARLACEWIARAKDDPSLQSVIYGVAASVFNACGEFRDALRYQDMAYSTASEAGNTEAAFRAAAYAMLVSSRMSDNGAVRSWREKCVALLPDITSQLALLTYYQAECSICLRAGDNAGALVYFRKILDLDGIENMPFVVFDCYNNIHLAHAGLGEYRQAYEALAKATELRDSLWQQEKAQSLRELTVKYETKETELALAQSEARRATTLMWLIAAGALLIVVITLFIIYSGRQRRLRMRREMDYAALKADIARKLTRQYVEGLENERARMSRELHDGVCNDLLAIGMNIRNGESIETTGRLIDTCRESVRRISHELMPPEFAYASVDEVVRFFVTKQADAAPEGVRLTFSSSHSAGTWTSVPDNVALEIYRIVQEAVGNALRHSGATNIDVTMRIDGRHVRVTVADNGSMRLSGRKGLGLDSMRRRATSIGGTLRVATRPEGGTEATLEVDF